MREVTRLGSTRASGHISGTAIIAGGSKFFDKVIVVEPDSMAEVKRTRVAQAEQIHGLQAVTLCILRAIIPYFDDRVHKFGGRILESNAQLQLGATNVKFAPGSLPDTVFISRLALEQMLRAYVQEISNIQAIQGAVVGIVPDVTGHRIEKVLVQLKGDSNPTTELEAAMLADCSGPASIGLKLLEKTQGAGWGPYPKISYDPKISYATALVPVVDRLRESLPIFTRETGDYSNFEKLGYLKCIIPHAEQDDRIVCIIRADDNNLMCGIGGWDLSPDARPHAFSDYLQQVDSIWQNASNGASSEGNSNRMAVMDSLHVIEDALAEDGVVPQFKFCRMGPCYKIDYSTAPKPSNFVAIGDSFLRVNPTFGQGVSKALVDIASLNGALLDTKLLNARGWCLPDTFSTEMIERQYPRVMHMWDSTKDSDYGRRSTDCVTGESSDLGAFGRRYWRGVVRIASQDKAVAADIIKSLQLIAPPLDLLRPSLFVRAMWSVMRGT
ncbi:hypothetical protein FRC09_020904 [Ceratobasidium sp. 395]|nr:hypothetical protein FRC09_020904 [Ceratobasidium sp. 395]